MAAAVCAVVGWTQTAAQPCAPERILGIATLWSEVRWHQIDLPASNLDWEDGLARQMTSLCAARDDVQLASAVKTLLAPLGDRLFRTHEALVHGLQWDARKSVREDLGQGASLLHLHQGIVFSNGQGGLDARLTEALSAIADSTTVIVDLRPIDAARGGADIAAVEATVAALVGKDLQLPAERSLFRSDFRMGAAPEVEGALSGAIVTSSRVIAAKRSGRPPSVAFLANDDTVVPAAVVAMQHSGLAQVLLEVGSTWPRSAPIKTVAVSANLNVDFGVAQYLHPDGTAGLRVDGVFNSSGETGPRLGRELLGILRRKAARAGAGYSLVNPVVPVRESKPRKEMAPPDLAWRMVSAIKYWSTVRKVVPRDHLPPNWDKVLVSAVDSMADAKTGDAYVQVLMKMSAALNDGHAKVMGRLARESIGDAQVAIRLASIEGKVVVVGSPAQPVGGGGIRAGDEVLSIDGISVSDRVAQAMPLVSASTPAGKVRDALQIILRGPSGKNLRLTASDESGKTKDIVMVYGGSAPVAPEQHGPYRRLSERIGYVDMRQLQRAQVQPMFEHLGSCGALIFDLRGYPNGTAWEIASRLGGPSMRRVTSQGSIVSSTLMAQAGLTYSDGPGQSKGEPYRGNVIVLVNEETQSQAEHSVLLFEAATKVTIVGSQTAGSDGDLAVDVLPGGVYVSMTGFDVRHSNGARVQGVGIVPDVLVSPTLRGIREGRDEVLEAAQRIAGRLSEE